MWLELQCSGQFQQDGLPPRHYFKEMDIPMVGVGQFCQDSIVMVMPMVGGGQFQHYCSMGGYGGQWVVLTRWNHPPCKKYE